jgi:hypothetical protein
MWVAFDYRQLHIGFVTWDFKTSLKIVIKEKFNGKFTTARLRFWLEGS